MLALRVRSGFRWALAHRRVRLQNGLGPMDRRLERYAYTRYGHSLSMTKSICYDDVVIPFFLFFNEQAVFWKFTFPLHAARTIGHIRFVLISIALHYSSDIKGLFSIRFTEKKRMDAVTHS